MVLMRVAWIRMHLHGMVTRQKAVQDLSIGYRIVGELQTVFDYAE